MKGDVDQLKADVREAFGLLRDAAKQVADASAAMRELQGEIRGAKWGGSAMSGFLGALIATGVSLGAFLWHARGG